MNLEELPEQIDAWKLCLEGVSLNGTYTVNKLKKLEGLVLPEEQAISFNIQFQLDSESYFVIIGNWHATVSVQCQRCLEPTRLTLQENFYLALVENIEKIKELPERYEPIMLAKEENLSLYDFFGEEIALALPIVPKHSDDGCAAHLFNLESQSLQEEPTINPFSILKAFD